MSIFSYNIRVKLLLRYFRHMAKRKVKPFLFDDFKYGISYATKGGVDYYFNSLSFTSFTKNISGATNYCDIESLKEGLKEARVSYALNKVKNLNLLLKNFKKYIKHTKLIRNL